MKFFQRGLTIVFTILFFQLSAQHEIPKGFSKGSLVLSDRTIITGFVKDNLRKDASVKFLAAPGEKKKTYAGYDLLSAELGDNRFICLKGDFFKAVCTGELCFLQKSSDASGKPIYNGTEALFVNGTPGKPGDYFIYDNRVKELKLVSNKTFARVTSGAFAGCAAAIEKAKGLQGNIARLNEAVIIYNNLGGK